MSTISQCLDTQYCFHAYVAHMHRRGIPTTFLDVGAYVGEASLYMANFARTSGIQFQAIAFDPSLAGTLLPYNIELNGLQDWITYEDLAIAPFDGPTMFSCNAKMMDSASLEKTRRCGCRYFSCLRKKLSTYIKTRRLDDARLLVKLDTEGYEPFIMKDLVANCKYLPSIIFEFCPGALRDKGFHCENFLTQLAEHFVLFSAVHAPKPYRLDRIHFEKIPEKVPRNNLFAVQFLGHLGDSV